MIKKLTRRDLLMLLLGSAISFVVTVTGNIFSEEISEEIKRHFFKYAELKVLNLEQWYYANVGQAKEITFYLYNSGSIPANIKSILLYVVEENVKILIKVNIIMMLI